MNLIDNGDFSFAFCLFTFAFSEFYERHLHHAAADTPTEFTVGSDDHLISLPPWTAAGAFCNDKQHHGLISTEPFGNKLPEVELLVHDKSLTQVNLKPQMPFICVR